MITGAVLFAIVALILTFSFPENPTYDRGTVFGFLLAICAVIGVALGAVVALLLDRATARRARSVQADRIDVRILEPESSPARREGSQPEPGERDTSTSDSES
jgi:nitrogen fixation/metabolism regulation signal transduction histidine kinase